MRTKYFFQKSQWSYLRSIYLFMIFICWSRDNHRGVLREAREYCDNKPLNFMIIHQNKYGNWQEQ